MNSIKNQAIWLFGGTCFAAILQVIQLGVLARVLQPRDLGILAIINSILTIAMVLQDMGMSSYLVHRQKITMKEQSTIFWVNMTFGLFTGLLLLILAYPIAIFYKLPDLRYLLMLVSLNFFVLGALSQYQAHYIKVKRVVSLAKIEMFSKLLSFVFVIYCLYYTSLGISSVIIGLFINAALRVIIMILFSERSWHPTMEFCGITFKAAINYGIYQLGSQIINQFRTQADSLIIGKILGAELLGVYSLAKELVLQPLKLLTPVINRLALPRFAENQNSPKDLHAIFLKSTFYIVLISSLGYLVISIFAPTVVNIIYGYGHSKVAQILPLMLIFGMLRPMGGLTGSISQANGRTNIEFYWNIWASLVMLAVIIAAVATKNLFWVGLSLSISQLAISVLVHPLFIKPVVGVTFHEYLKTWVFNTIIFIVIMAIQYKYNLYVTL